MRVVVVVQWLSEWDVVSSDGKGLVGSTAVVLPWKMSWAYTSGTQEHGDVAARVHDDVLFAFGEPPSFEQRQHLTARDAAAIGDASIVQCPLDLLLAQFSECPCRCLGPLLPELALGFLESVPK